MADFALENQFHTVLADSVFNEIISGRTNFHYFIGGVNGATVVPTNNSYNYELLVRNNMLATKKIAAADISLVVPRLNWTTGTIYDFYDDNFLAYPAHSGAISQATAQFFVLTSDYNVYVCLNNNNSTSTVMPTGTSTSTFSTSDGYIWKFLYNIPPASINKFLNTGFMPVQTSVQNQFYSSGQILSTNITNNGTGYTTCNLTVTGDGTGCTMTAVLSGGQLSNVTVNTPGTGYTYANVGITGNGTNASVTVNLSAGDMTTTQSNVELLATNGSIENIRVLNGGTGYSTATVVISGDGSGCTANAILSGGVVTGVTILTTGLNYTHATATITGNGTGCTLRPIMSPRGGHGYNAINELSASSLIFYTTITGQTAQGLPISNNFQQVGIIRDINIFGSTYSYHGTNGTPLYLFTVTGSPVLNDILIDSVSGASYQVFAISGSQIAVQAFGNNVPAINNLLNNTTHGGTSTISAVTIPTIDKFSGELLYISNVLAVESSSDQIITFKTSIKF